MEEALRLYEETQNAEVEAEAEAEPETQPETDVSYIIISREACLTTQTEIPTAAAIPSPGPTTSAPIPETLVAKSDDAMKSLMMSWYYAGYYTGRLEGRREALAEVQKS